MSLWKLSVRVLNTAAILHSQNRWIQAVEQRVESLIIVWEKVSYRMKLRAKCRAYLAQQNETFEGCSIWIESKSEGRTS